MNNGMIRPALPVPIEREELQAYFQPVVNLQTGEIVALEANLRRLIKDGVLQSAAEVLALAATTRQESEIDGYMLEMAAQGHAMLQAAQVNPLPITVNIAYATLTDTAALNELEKMLRQLAPPRGLLRLEIPERAVLEQSELMLKYLGAWRKKGYVLTIDHVTSEAVLSAAMDLDAIVKFSENLLEQISADNTDTCRIRELIKKAAALKLKTAAEGIYRLDQLRALQQAGCIEGQGLLVSKPRPLPELVFLIKRGSCW